jgi:hypothetical protein
MRKAVLFISSLLMSATPQASAHMQEMLNPDFYIRVIAHPEMVDYYSYGFCKKKFQKNSRVYDHTDEECAHPEGQQWWYIPSAKNYKKGLLDEPNLLDVLKDKNNSLYATSSIIKKSPFSIENYKPEVTGVLENGVKVNSINRVMLPASFPVPVNPAILKSKRLEFMGNASENRAVESFDQCFKDLEKVSIPKDKSCIDLFFKDKTVFLKKNRDTCMENCTPQASKMRIVFAEFFKNEKQQLLELDDDEICELRCDEDLRTPSLEELWKHVTDNLNKAEHHQYKRVLNKDPADIRYITQEEFSNPDEEEKNPMEMKELTFKYACPIGSECDHTYAFHKPDSNAAPIYKKITVKQLTDAYSSNVWKSMMPVYFDAKTHEVTSNHFDFKTTNDLVTKAGYQYSIRKDVDVESITITSSKGELQDTTKMYNAETKTLDTLHLQNGTYQLKIKFQGIRESYSEPFTIAHNIENFIQYDSIANLFFINSEEIDDDDVQVFSMSGVRQPVYPNPDGYRGKFGYIVKTNELPIGAYLVHIKLTVPPVEFVKRVVVTH